MKFAAASLEAGQGVKAIVLALKQQSGLLNDSTLLMRAHGPDARRTPILRNVEPGKMVGRTASPVGVRGERIERQ